MPEKKPPKVEAPPEGQQTSPKKRLGGISRQSMGLLVFTVILMVFGGLSLFFRPDNQETALTQLPLFDLQGHRGARGLYPENSLPGFEAALALGVTTLEMDLGMSRDGILVVHHDDHLDPRRTRDATGAWIEPPGKALSALSLAELQSYDIGRVRPESDYDARFPDQRGLDGVTLPSLRQVLARTEDLSGGKIRYNLEIKTSPLDPDNTVSPEVMAAALVGVLQEFDLTARATVQSFDWRGLETVGELAPETARVYLTVEQSWFDNLQRGKAGLSPWLAGLDMDGLQLTPPHAIKTLGGRVWSPYFRDLRGAELREAHGIGLKVVPWTVNDPKDMRSLVELGVDGIITDYPDRLRQVLQDLGKPLPEAFPTAGIATGER